MWAGEGSCSRPGNSDRGSVRGQAALSPTGFGPFPIFCGYNQKCLFQKFIFGKSPYCVTGVITVLLEELLICRAKEGLGLESENWKDR